MYQFAPAQQSSTPKLRIFVLNFKKRACKVRVNDTKHDTEVASNWDDFGFGVNSESKCDEMALFRVSLQNFDWCFKPQATDNLDLRFSATVSATVSAKFIRLYIKES